MMMRSMMPVMRRTRAGGKFEWRTLLTAMLALAFLIAMLSITAHAAHAGPRGAAPAPMVEPLKVCADPNNLPFSNRAGQGFENRLAQMIAGAMHTQVEYTWWPQREDFLRDTIDAGACDVVMALPTQSTEELTTIPYYRSTYAIVYRADAPYKIKSLRDPLLRKLSIGVQAVGDDIADIPPGAVLAHRGIVKNLVLYKLYADYSRPNPPARLIEDVASGKIDVAIAWGPLAGYFATRQPVKLKVVPLTHTHAILPFQFSISMAVRPGDQALRNRLNKILRARQAAIHTLLARYHVPLLALPNASGTAEVAGR
ncbi:MAG TPA: quinoprotein dehydrogenase-associated putative ABC transporter substrate-binding protein [Gammaproteobacteria bacterium]|nr:quinoprotein dehydrogenase-associated putative ABC transporter substrate-binding protein [Gammaproteobacteria bacterium]